MAPPRGQAANPPPPPATDVHLGQTVRLWLARGVVISSTHVTRGTGNVSVVIEHPNGFRVTGVTKGTAAVTVSGILTVYPRGKPPVTTPFTTTCSFIVD